MKEQISARGSSAGKGGGAGKVAKVGICKSDCDFFFSGSSRKRSGYCFKDIQIDKVDVEGSD